MTEVAIAPASAERAPAWTLTPAELDATREKIAKINKRAARRGFLGRIELEAERREITTKNEVGLEITEIVYSTRLVGEAPCYGGWRLLAVLDWDPAAGLLVRTAPGVERVDRSGLQEGWCAHCRTSRPRAKTYLVGRSRRSARSEARTNGLERRRRNGHTRPRGRARAVNFYRH